MQDDDVEEDEVEDADLEDDHAENEVEDAAPQSKCIWTCEKSNCYV